MAFLTSFVGTFVKLIIFALIALAGVIVGKKWRISKDAKAAAEEALEEKQKK